MTTVRVKVTGVPSSAVVEYCAVWGLSIRNWFGAVDPNSEQSLLCPPVAKSIGITFHVVLAGGI